MITMFLIFFAIISFLINIRNIILRLTRDYSPYFFDIWSIKIYMHIYGSYHWKKRIKGWKLPIKNIIVVIFLNTNTGTWLKDNFFFNFIASRLYFNTFQLLLFCNMFRYYKCSLNNLNTNLNFSRNTHMLI